MLIVGLVGDTWCARQYHDPYDWLACLGWGLTIFGGLALGVLAVNLPGTIHLFVLFIKQLAEDLYDMGTQAVNHGGTSSYSDLPPFSVSCLTLHMDRFPEGRSRVTTPCSLGFDEGCVRFLRDRTGHSSPVQCPCRPQGAHQEVLLRFDSTPSHPSRHQGTLE